MAKSNKGVAAARALTGAERHCRATARLTEAAAQLATIEQHLTDGAREIETLGEMEASARQDVESAEREADQAAAAIVEAHGALLVVEGSEEEGGARALHSAAVEAHQATRARLDDARTTLEQIHARAERETAMAQATLDELKGQRRDALRMVQSLERAVADAHEQAGRELLDEMKARHHELVSLRDQARAAARDAEATLRESRIEAATRLAPWSERLAEAAEAGVVANERDALEAVYEAFSTLLQAFEDGQGTFQNPSHVVAPSPVHDSRLTITLIDDVLQFDAAALNVLLHSRSDAPRILAERRKRLEIVRGRRSIMEDAAIANAVRLVRAHYDEQGRPLSPQAKIGIRPW